MNYSRFWNCFYINIHFPGLLLTLVFYLDSGRKCQKLQGSIYENQGTIVIILQ
jgi:hypothetical protein